MLTQFHPKTAVVWRTLTSALLLLVVGIAAALAQTASSGTIRGTIKDPNGAIIPSANVTLKSNRTGTERTVQSSNEGLYVFVAVDPGSYTLTVEASGFKKFVQSDLVVSPAESKGLDIPLQVGQTSETINITGSAIEEIKTETGERSNTIKASQIENLSIISRSSLELLRVLPGVVAPDQSSYQISGFGDASAYTVNGQRGFNNNVSVDGSRVIDIGCNCGSIVSLNNDMVAEVTIKASNYSADSGNSGVGIIATHKSGSRDFHGAVYNYVRHDALSSNDRFRNYVKAEIERTSPGSSKLPGSPAAKPVGRFYYPGGNLSGPVMLPKSVFGPLGMEQAREKLFFFVGFEVQQQSFSGDSKTNVVPTAKQRLGDFSELLGKSILNQGSTVKIPGGFTGTGQNAANNNLAPYIHPYGKALLNLYPLPNYNDPTGRYNYIATPLDFQNRKDLKMRFDYKHSDKTNLYVRITREKEQEDGPYGIWWGPSNYELPTHNVSNNLGRSVAVGMTRIFSPTMTNEVIFSGSKLKLDNNYSDPNKVSLSTLGLQNLKLPFDARFGRQAQTAPSAISWAQGSLWAPGTNPIFAYNDSFSITDNLTKVAGGHTLKFGALIEQGNKKQNFEDNSQGRLVMDQWTSNSTGNDWGDLLVGQFGSIDHSVRTPTGNFRFYNYEFYAQDSWKVRPNFTFEYGLRAAYMRLNQERNGFDTLFLASAYKRGAGYYLNGDPFRPNGVLSAKRGEIPKGAIDNPPLLWGPRLNFAWDIRGNSDLVVRGGGGIFYNRVMGNFQYDATLRSPVNGNVGASVGQGTTIPGTNTTFAQLGGLTFNNVHLADPLKLAGGGGDIISPDPKSNNLQTTYTMSLSIAKRLPFQTVLETGYVSTMGRHLAARLPINKIPLGALLRGGVTGDPGSTITTLANPNCDPNKPGDCRIVTTTGAKVDLTNPLHRLSLDGGVINSFRPFPDVGYIRYNQYTGTSNYHSLQVTLSRQTGKSLQFFGTYTFSKALGTTAQDYADLDPLDARGRTYGVLNYDRTHIFNLSYNWNVPNLARGGFSHPLTNGLLNGWQLSGITTFSSGTPLNLVLTGPVAGLGLAAFGSDAFAGGGGNASGAIAPVFSKDPRLSGKTACDPTKPPTNDCKVLDLSAISIPAFGTTGPTISPYYFRTPNRANWDISLFKNFKIRESKVLQFRAGFFNVFNQAFPKNINNTDAGGSDIFLTLETDCVARTPANLQITNADGTKTSFTQTFPNGAGGSAQGLCDPSKGFKFTDNTLNNFGRIRTKRGQRVIELALKFTF
jgi:hypothetical protein